MARVPVYAAMLGIAPPQGLLLLRETAAVHASLNKLLRS